MEQTYQTRAAKIREERNKSLQAKIPDLQQFYEKTDKSKIQKILNATSIQLSHMLNQGQSTSIQLVKIFSLRAGTIGRQLEAITEDNFQRAIEMAQHCDKLRKQKGWNNGSVGSQSKEQFSPLFGIPFSVKDAINMKGFASSYGAVERCGEKEEEDGEIIRVLKEAGMIPFVRSNVPQLCLTYESNNIIWGQALNPWNRERTPGGSSGGEGSLISSRCSPLGLGTDVGGSVRIPALYCGIYSLKPSFPRMIFKGHCRTAPSLQGQINIKYNMGPLAKGTEDLAAFMKVMCDKKYFPKGCQDPHKKLIPFDSQTYQGISSNSQKLKIGYFDSIEIYPTSPASRRVVQETVKILEAKGHTMVRVEIPCPQEIIKIFINVLVAQGGFKGYKQTLKGEPLASYYQLTDQILSYPRATTWILGKTIQKTNPRMSLVLSALRGLNAYQYLQLTTKQQQIKKLYFKMWEKQELDLMISPGFCIQAHKLGFVDRLGLLPALYTFMYNVLDVPAGCVPVSIVRDDQQEYQSSYQDKWNQLTKESQKGTTGLPVGIQVVGLPYDQEKVLGMMKLLEKEIDFKSKHPYPI